MTTQEKIKALECAMTVSKRKDDTEYTHFTDEVPQELKDLFLEHYEVRDTDYKVFNRACDIVVEIYGEQSEEQHAHHVDQDINNGIYEKSNDSASVYTADRLALLDNWNQEDITQNVRDLGVDIADACAIWYDKEVENACFIIKEWVEAK